MLKNDELKQIKTAYLLLEALNRGFITTDETDIIYQSKENLKRIYNKHITKKQKASERANAYNKTNREYHNITVNMAHYKKKGNMEKYNYWKQQFTDYNKRKKEVK